MPSFSVFACCINVQFQQIGPPCERHHDRIAAHRPPISKAIVVSPTMANSSAQDDDAKTDYYPISIPRSDGKGYTNLDHNPLNLKEDQDIQQLERWEVIIAGHLQYQLGLKDDSECGISGVLARSDRKRKLICSQNSSSSPASPRGMNFAAPLEGTAAGTTTCMATQQDRSPTIGRQVTLFCTCSGWRVPQPNTASARAISAQE